ncbi:hypothetical protein [Novosphingobium sp. KN65.2]|uniref:hypothetical protein n=1 Tax=Novosphingobium sp. KN65.2 TaxID=1478134 RepID=UPI0018D190F3|nr:hypothetical protein [Novosphingobium sp. KN65.2]
MDTRDEKLLEFATKRRAETLPPSGKWAAKPLPAKALGVKPHTVSGTISALQKKSARLGRAPGHFDNGAAPVYAMGKLTVRRGRTGEIDRTRKSLLRLACQKRHEIHYVT